jgi:hypothetical protein
MQITGNNRDWLSTAHSSKEPEFNDQVEDLLDRFTLAQIQAEAMQIIGGDLRQLPRADLLLSERTQFRLSPAGENWRRFCETNPIVS